MKCNTIQIHITDLNCTELKNVIYEKKNFIGRDIIVFCNKFLHVRRSSSDVSDGAERPDAFENLHTVKWFESLSFCKQTATSHSDVYCRSCGEQKRSVRNDRIVTLLGTFAI